MNYRFDAVGDVPFSQPTFLKTTDNLNKFIINKVIIIFRVTYVILLIIIIIIF